ncbi:MAG: methionyl-tRNA formyltransferase [Alphaproteobacteria bacterium]|jgi:methionyl-tRNA formyltransferase|nr:methionyl-tRNA formyltransferase [Alphaproteobacteria bacterium]
MTRLKLAYMGTPDFAVPSLAALVEAGHEVAAVYSQPPRRAGRGQKERPSPVHAWAEEHGLPVRTPRTLRDEGAQAEFAALDLDAAIVAAYGLILPLPVLEAPRLGCINVHASLLPRWRGAAPIQRAILAGDTETGISIMMMEEGLDTGPVLRMESLPIGPETTAGELHDALAALGGRMIAPVLADFEAGHIVPEPQDDAGTTYAKKTEKSEARIDWSEEASMVARRIHAFAPWPGAWFTLGGERVKALAARIEPGDGAPGAVLDDTLRVACGSSAVRLLRLQREGKKPAAAADFLRGRSVATGTVLE